jgi:hypothetical protein
VNSGTIARKLEVGANVGIIVVVLLALGLWLTGHWSRQSDPRHPLPVGAKFELKGVDWRANKRSVVLAISTTCHYCTESAGFYRELVTKCQSAHVRMIAVLPQPLEQAKAYLEAQGVSVDEIRHSSLPEIQISGTPTLLLVDDAGTVRAIWVGKLPPESEQQVLARVGS